MRRAGGMLPVHWPTLRLAGALPLGALPPKVPGMGPPPLGKVAGFPPPALPLAICLVLTIYNISAYSLSLSYGLPLPNTTSQLDTYS